MGIKTEQKTINCVREVNAKKVQNLFTPPVTVTAEYWPVTNIIRPARVGVVY